MTKQIAKSAASKAKRRPKLRPAAAKKPEIKTSEVDASRATTSEAAAADPKLRNFVVFGLDQNKKPVAARFVGDQLGLLAKAAEQLKLTIRDVDTPELAELSGKLAAGRLYANGRGFVPHVRPDLYKKILAAVGGEAALQEAPAPAAQGSPQRFEDIVPGHIVIAQESHDDGWWEAIVLERNGDMLTLRYRDYPTLPRFTRHRSAVALVSSPAA